jgi:hypothetical protein
MTAPNPTNSILLGKAQPGAQREEWLRPLEAGADMSGWETLPMPDDQPRGPRGSIFAVDLDAEQTAWLHHRSGEEGISPIELIKALVEAARTAEPPARRPISG